MKRHLHSGVRPCRLCGQTRELRDSHIIPSFCYKPLRDINGRLSQLSLVHGVDKYFGMRGRGYVEKLLCEECEGRISRFETVGAKLFQQPLPPHSGSSKRIREYPSLDYGRLKLFFLSILWRTSVASDEFFRLVSLGPHEETVRKMLLNEDPGPGEKYDTYIFLLKNGGDHVRDLMTEPTPMTFEHRKYYRFVMSGFVIIMGVSALSPSKMMLNMLLSPEKPVRSFDAELAEFRFLNGIPARMAAAVPG